MNWIVTPPIAVVERELLALPADMQARFLRIADLLSEFGPQQVGMPYVRPLGGKLWEIRLSGRSGIGRILFAAATGRRLVLLHAFIKKTQRTPQRALALAQRRLREVE
jgi:phage-related protein